MIRVFKVLLSLTLPLLFAACATPGFAPEMRMTDAQINPESVTGHALRWLPAPNQNITVAVYNIADETGAFKPSEGGQTLSRAVTQAPTPILIKALQDAGNRTWFDVIERENLGNLIKERQIIQEMRARYLGETELNQAALPALKFAGVIIEGAITGYDTNTRTGGAGARYLGIGGSTQYREDSVSVSLRAVSVKTGEILVSIATQQRVASVALQGDAFRFVSFQRLLEAEAGVTLNQPRHMAVRQALEKAVYGLIVEGAEYGLWGFEDQNAGLAALEHYRENYAPLPQAIDGGRLPPEFYQAHMDREERRRVQLAAARAPVRHIAPRPAAAVQPQGDRSPNIAPRPSSPTPAQTTGAPQTADAKASTIAATGDANDTAPQLSALDELSWSGEGHLLHKVQNAQASAAIISERENRASSENTANDILASAGHTTTGNPTRNDDGATANLVLLNSGGGQ